MLRFSPSTGLEAPSTAEIRADVTARFKEAFSNAEGVELNTEPETPAGQLIDSITAMIADKNAEILYLANQFNPLTAEGVWQAALGKIYFLTPKIAENSVATCTCTGLWGTVIHEGAVIKSAVDGVEWKSLSTVTIPSSGSVSVQFRCSQGGPLGAEANTLTRIVTVTPGWDTVTNPVSAVVGSNAETQVAFEKRRYASVAQNAKGSVQAIQAALNTLDGVIDAVVLENATSSAVTKNGVSIPAHSIYASVYGGSDGDIAELLYRKKNAGCGTAGNTEISYTDMELFQTPTYTFKIQRPTPTPIKVKVLVRNAVTLPVGYDEIVKKAIIADFNGEGENIRVGTAQTVYASRFFAPVIKAGITDVTDIDIKVNNDASWLDVITINANIEPTISASDITVTKV